MVWAWHVAVAVVVSNVRGPEADLGGQFRGEARDAGGQCFVSSVAAWWQDLQTSAKRLAAV